MQGETKKSREVQHWFVIGEYFAHHVPDAVLAGPVEETAHQMGGEAVSFDVRLHRDGEFAGFPIMLARQPGHADGLSCAVADRDECHVSVVVQAGEFGELLRGEFADRGKEAEADVFWREPVEEGVVRRGVLGQNRADGEGFAPGLPMLLQFSRVDHYRGRVNLTTWHRNFKAGGISDNVLWLGDGGRGMAEDVRTARGVRKRVTWSLLLAAMLAMPRPLLAYVWHGTDITGYGPDLSFRMTDAGTGKVVSQADFKGKFTLLYFGYTQCPDICPLTLGRVAQVFDALGKDARRFRLLFVTVDPDRDTPAVLKQYTEAFSPLFLGLRGDADAVAKLARRYRIAYSVEPARKDHPYEVTHSSAIYVFAPDGSPRLLLGSLSTTDPDISGTAADLEHLLHEAPAGWVARLMGVL